MSSAADHPVRVVIQQFSLLRYRIPVHRELASRPGLQVKVVYGSQQGAAMGDGEAEGFDADLQPVRIIRFAGFRLLWHSAQWRFASRRHADVLILSWDLHYPLLIPALIRAKLTGLPTILWGHGYSRQESSLRRWLRNRVARLATAVLLYNHTTERKFLDEGWDAKRVHVALNSLDQAPIQEARESWLSHREELDAFRREHNLGDGPVVLFVSRLFEGNRVDLLLQAACRIVDQFPGMRVVIVGDGPDKQRLMAMAEKLGIAEATLFTGSIYGEQHIAPWFLTATVFCYPVHIGLSMLHAFGYGVPVITSDDIDAQNPEIEALEPGRNGLVYADGDVDDLAKKLADVLGDPQRRRELSEQAHATVMGRFNVQNMVDGMERAVRYAASRA